MTLKALAAVNTAKRFYKRKHSDDVFGQENVKIANIGKPKLQRQKRWL